MKHNMENYFLWMSSYKYPDVCAEIIKIDVEGSELYVLHWAKDSILKHSPVIEYSQETSYNDGYKREEIIEILKCLAILFMVFLKILMDIG